MFKKSGQTHRRGSRAIALGVAFVFTLTSITWSTPTLAAPSDVSLAPAMPIEKLSIPAEMGSISKTYRGSGDVAPHDRMVVLIQDAHAVVDAQENISKILGHLGKAYGIRLTALEGAKGRLEPILFRAFPDPIVKRNILAGYENRAELSGPEMASVFQEEAADFRGMEDWALYEQNYFAYLRGQEKKEALLKKWSGFKEKRDKERAKVYDEKLNEFQEARENFLAERSSLLDLLVYLSNFKPLFSSGDYKELPGLIDSMGYEKAGKSEALVPMVRKIADEFKVKYLRSLGVKTEMNFYNRYQAFMTGQITAGQMLQYLVQVGREHGKNIKLTPALKKLLGHAELLSEIRGSTLYEELQRFLPVVEASLLKTPEQRKMADVYGKLFLLRELIELELTHEALEKYQKEPDAYLDLLGDPQFRKDLVPALEFYRAALERDQAFLAKINAMMADSKQNNAAVVAGGFHTNGIERLLKNKGISYAVVTPKIASLAGIENYAKVMKGDISFKDDLKTTYFDALMRHASKALIEALPIPDRVRTLKTWRDNLIRELAKQGRITEAGKYLPYIDGILQTMPEMVSAVGPVRTKEETLDLIRKELERFKKDSLERIWKTFEFQLGVFTDGLKQLIAKKDLNESSVSLLLNRASQTKPQFVSWVQCLDGEIGVLGQSVPMVPDTSNIFATRPQILDELGRIAQGTPLGIAGPAIAATAAQLSKIGMATEEAVRSGEIGTPEPSVTGPAVEGIVDQLAAGADKRVVAAQLANEMNSQLPGRIAPTSDLRSEARSELRAELEKRLGAMRSFGRNERFAGATVRIYLEKKGEFYEWVVKASDANIFHFVMRENLAGELVGYYQRFEVDRQSRSETAQGDIHTVGESKAFGNHHFFAGKRDQSMDPLHFSVRPGKDAKGAFVNIEVESKEKGVEVRWDGSMEKVPEKVLEAKKEEVPHDDTPTAETVETLEPEESVTNREAFGPEQYTLAGITRSPRTISVDVPAFRFRNGRIEQNPDYHNPALEGDESFSEIVRALEKELSGLSQQDQAVLTQAANGWILGDDAVSDWITHAVHLLNERDYTKRDLGLRDFIRQYLKDSLRYLRASGQEQARFAEELAKHYRYFSRTQLLREKPQSKFSVLHGSDLSRLRIAPEGDSRSLSPHVMTIEPIVYQFNKGRRFRGEEIPPEKLVFAKWKGRTFLFYTSRTHAVAGVTQHTWRHAEAYFGLRGGWLVKHMGESYPENMDDLPPQIGQLLDEIIYSPDVRTLQSSEAFVKRADELGLLNFTDWNELATIFEARSADDLKRTMGKVRGAGLVDKLSGMKVNPQILQARDYMLEQFNNPDADDESPTQNFEEPETETWDTPTRSEVRDALSSEQNIAGSVERIGQALLKVAPKNLAGVDIAEAAVAVQAFRSDMGGNVKVVFQPDRTAENPRPKKVMLSDGEGEIILLRSQDLLDMIDLRYVGREMNIKENIREEDIPAFKRPEVAEIHQELKLFLSTLTRNRFLEMVRNISGDSSLQWEDLGGDVSLDAYMAGSNKHVFKVTLTRSAGDALSFAVATKIGRTDASIAQTEINEMEVLNDRPEQVTPRFGGARHTKGRRWYVEEFIEGKTVRDLEKENRVTEDVRRGVISALLSVSMGLKGKMPRDMHSNNFVVRQSDGRVIMVDIGVNRFNVLDQIDNAIQKETQAHHRIASLAVILAQYGYVEGSPEQNDFIFDTLMNDEDLPPGEGKRWVEGVYQNLAGRDVSEIADFLHNRKWLNHFRSIFESRGYGEYPTEEQSKSALRSVASMLQTSITRYAEERGMKSGQPSVSLIPSVGERSTRSEVRTGSDGADASIPGNVRTQALAEIGGVMISARSLADMVPFVQDAIRVAVAGNNYQGLEEFSEILTVMVPALDGQDHVFIVAPRFPTKENKVGTFHQELVEKAGLGSRKKEMIRASLDFAPMGVLEEIYLIPSISGLRVGDDGTVDASSKLPELKQFGSFLFDVFSGMGYTPQDLDKIKLTLDSSVQDALGGREIRLSQLAEVSAEDASRSELRLRDMYGYLMNKVLMPAVLAVWLALPSFATAQPNQPYSARFDPAMGMEAGAENLYSGYRALNEFAIDPVTGSIPYLENNPLGRFVKLFAVDRISADFFWVAQHEFFGHGAQSREVGDYGSSYRMNFETPRLEYFNGYRIFGWWSGAASRGDREYSTDESLETIAGGMESTQVMSDWIRWNMFRYGATAQDAVLYYVSKLDLTDYIETTPSPASRAGLIVKGGGNSDVDAYGEEMTAKYGEDADLWSDMERAALWNALDPTIWISAFRQLDYVARGTREFRLPRILPYTGANLTPLGPEYYLGAHFTAAELYYDVYGRKGVGPAGEFYGAGLRVGDIDLGNGYSLGMNLDAWDQERFGFAVRTTVSKSLSDRFRISAGADYKTEGYLKGRQSDEGVSGFISVQGALSRPEVRSTSGRSELREGEVSVKAGLFDAVIQLNEAVKYLIMPASMLAGFYLWKSSLLLLAKASLLPEGTLMIVASFTTAFLGVVLGANAMLRLLFNPERTTIYRGIHGSADTILDVLRRGDIVEAPKPSDEIAWSEVIGHFGGKPSSSLKSMTPQKRWAEYYTLFSAYGQKDVSRGERFLNAFKEIFARKFMKDQRIKIVTTPEEGAQLLSELQEQGGINGEIGLLETVPGVPNAQSRMLYWNPFGGHIEIALAYGVTPKEISTVEIFIPREGNEHLGLEALSERAAGSVRSELRGMISRMTLGLTMAAILSFSALSAEGAQKRDAKTSQIQTELVSMGYLQDSDVQGNYGFYGPKTKAAVTRLQTDLKKTGHYKGPIDGDYGPGTDRALRAWQQAQGTAPAVPEAAVPVEGDQDVIDALEDLRGLRRDAPEHIFNLLLDSGQRRLSFDAKSELVSQMSFQEVLEKVSVRSGLAASEFERIAQKYDVPVESLIARGFKENPKFDPLVSGPDGRDIGLFQVRIDTVRDGRFFPLLKDLAVQEGLLKGAEAKASSRSITDAKLKQILKDSSINAEMSIMIHKTYSQEVARLKTVTVTGAAGIGSQALEVYLSGDYLEKGQAAYNIGVGNFQKIVNTVSVSGISGLPASLAKVARRGQAYAAEIEGFQEVLEATNNVPSTGQDLLAMNTRGRSEVRTVDQSEIAERVAAKHPSSSRFSKEPILGFEIMSVDWKNIPKAIRDRLGKVDQTYKEGVEKVLAANIGGFIALQMKGDQPDFYIVSPRVAQGKYQKTVIGYEGYDKLVRAMKAGVVEMIRMSDLGYSKDESVSIQVDWGSGPEKQTKPAGQDAYLAHDGKQWYMLNVNVEGLPISYVPVSASGSAANRVDLMIKGLIDVIARRQNLSDEDRKKVEMIAELAKTAHSGQKRKNGDPYFRHPLEMAWYMMTRFGNYSPVEFQVNLLHDTREDQAEFYEAIKAILDDMFAQLEKLGDSAQTEQDRRNYNLIRLGVRLLTKIVPEEVRGADGTVKWQITHKDVNGKDVTRTFDSEADADAAGQIQYYTQMLNPHRYFRKEIIAAGISEDEAARIRGRYADYDDAFIRGIQQAKLSDRIVNTRDLMNLFNPQVEQTDSIRKFPARMIGKTLDWMIPNLVEAENAGQGLHPDDRRMFYEGFVGILVDYANLDTGLNPMVKPLKDAALATLRDPRLQVGIEIAGMRREVDEAIQHRSEVRAGEVQPLRLNEQKENEFYERWGESLKKSGHRSPQALINIAQHIRESRQVVSYADFLGQMKGMQPKLAAALGTTGSYAVVWDEPAEGEADHMKLHKSRRWAWSLIRDGLRAPSAEIYGNELGKARGVSTFVIADDASYSGTQIRETIERISKANPRAQITIAVPYMTSRAERVIRSRRGLPEGVSIRVLEHETMPTLSEILTKSERDLFADNRTAFGTVTIDGKSYDVLLTAVTLFDHKVADSWSVYQRLAQFYDPVTPPYKNERSAYYQEESGTLAAEEVPVRAEVLEPEFYKTETKFQLVDSSARPGEPEAQKVPTLRAFEVFNLDLTTEEQRNVVERIQNGQAPNVMLLTREALLSKGAFTADTKAGIFPAELRGTELALGDNGKALFQTLYVNLLDPRLQGEGNIRVSVAGLFRIRVDRADITGFSEPLYLVILNKNRRTPEGLLTVGAIGGAYQTQGVAAPQDIRGLIEKPDSEAFLQWFVTGQGRETNPLREFEEEVLGAAGDQVNLFDELPTALRNFKTRSEAREQMVDMDVGKTYAMTLGSNGVWEKKEVGADVWPKNAEDIKPGRMGMIDLTAAGHRPIGFELNFCSALVLFTPTAVYYAHSFFENLNNLHDTNRLIRNQFYGREQQVTAMLGWGTDYQRMPAEKQEKLVSQQKAFGDILSEGFNTLSLEPGENIILKVAFDPKTQTLYARQEKPVGRSEAREEDATSSVLRVKGDKIPILVRDFIGTQIKSGTSALEMGIGSGALTRDLAEGASRLKDVQFVGVDINPEAVQMSRSLLGKYRNVRVLESDLFSAFTKGEKFDVIFWNPPWSSQGEAGTLALAKSDPGFETLSRFFKEAPMFLKPGGKVFLIMPVEAMEEIWEDASAKFEIDRKGWEKTKNSNIGIFELKPRALEQVQASDAVISSDSDWREVFQDNSRPLFVEVGVGDGKKSMLVAESRPDANFILIEPEASAFQKLQQTVRDSGLTNIRIVRGQDGDLFDLQKGSGFIDLIYCVAPFVNTPWPYFFSEGPKAPTYQRALSLLKSRGEILVMPDETLAGEWYDHFEGQYPNAEIVPQSRVFPGLNAALERYHQQVLDFKYSDPIVITRRSENRAVSGFWSSVESKDIVAEARDKGPDAARAMFERSGRTELGKIGDAYDAGSTDLMSVLRDAPSMSAALPEAVAQLSGRMGNDANLFNWPALQAGLENILMPTAMALETVNADVANIVPAQMKLLIDTLANIKGSLTIGLDLGTGKDAEIGSAVLEQLIKAIGERSGIVNELAVSGKLPGPARQTLKSRGINDRPIRPNQSFIPINAQDAVPLVMSSSAANGVIHQVFYPIVGDRGAVTDTLVNDYANLLEVVAAIHCADIISRQPNLLKQPELLKAELLKTLFRQEQGAVENLIQVRAGGRGFTVSSAAVKVYLEMMAKQSVEKAA